MNVKKLFLEYEEHEEGKTITDVFNEFLKEPSSKDLNYLSIGFWGEPNEDGPDEAIKVLIENKDKLPKLHGIFIGDMESEECEISWLIQSDLSTILTAFPELLELKIRGSSNLRLQNLKHNKLKRLIIECGGLGKDVINDIINGKLPSLEYLELYLGVEDYGFDGKLEDLKPLMKKGLFPNLKYLGLKNSEISDEIAMEVAKSDILDQIQTLDLSLGTLTDKGAQALVESSKLKNLKFLDLNYHFMSDAMMEKIEGIGIKVDVSDQQDDEGEDYRYPSVTE